MYRRERDARVAERFLAMALLAELAGVEEVAATLGCHPDTIHNWISRYNAGGEAGLRPTPPPGRPPLLTPEEQEALGRDLLESPREFGYGFANWDGRAVQHHIAEKFGVAMTRDGVYAVLHRLGFRLVVPRPKLAKADEKKERPSWQNSRP